MPLLAEYVRAPHTSHPATPAPNKALDAYKKSAHTSLLAEDSASAFGN